MMGLLKSAIRFPSVLRARARDARFDRRVRHELAVAAIFREEAPFLDEWLAFHAAVGVTHFYLYNNFSTDEYREILEPWIARRLVTLTEWPVPVGQLPAYRHCVRHHADASRWIAFIDIDEYLFSPCQTDIVPILAEYQDLPGLLIHSPFFGSSGLRCRPSGPLVEAFTRRAPLTHTTIKTIANPRWIYAVRNVHAFKYWAGEACDTARRPWNAANPPVLDLLRLNHYWSRSLEDLKVKVSRGDASTAEPRCIEWHFAFETKLNAVEDHTIIPISRTAHRRKIEVDSRFLEMSY